MDQYPPQLRQQFFGNVLGPIGHHCVVVAMPEAELNIRNHLSNPMTFENSFGNFLKRDLKNTQSALLGLLDGVIRGFVFTAARLKEQSKFPFTESQFHFLRYLQENKQGLCEERDKRYLLESDGKLTVEGSSVVRAVSAIAFRTPGLEICGVQDLIDLLKRRELASVVRPMMAGGSDFDNFVRRKRGEPVPYMFRFFNETDQPVALIREDGSLEPNPLVLELARKFNRYINANVDSTSIGNSFKGNAAGCPLKDLGFLQSTPLLDRFEASLTDEQIEILTSGDNPTAVRIASRRPNTPAEDSNRFLIVRDAIQEIIDMVADQLEELMVVFEMAEKVHTNNDYLLGNMALMLGKPFNPSEFARKATGDTCSVPTLQREPVAIS